MELVSTNKLFKCSLCLTSFFLKGPKTLYGGNKKPFLLHCGHSACWKCLSTEFSTNNEVSCKSCKSVSSVPSSFTVNELSQYFPANYFLIGVWSTESSSAVRANELDSNIKFTKPKPNSRKIKTVICNECMESPAESYCKQCSAPYCELCFKMIHLAARALRSHTKVPLVENYLNIEPDKPLMCSVHLGSKLEFYCVQCSVPSCSRCMIEKHQGHNIDLLENIKENCEDEFIDRYVKVTNVLQRLKASHKKAEHIFNAKQESGGPLKNIHEEIFKTFTHLFGKLIVLQNNMHSKIHQADDNRLLAKMLSELYESINTTEALLVSTKALLRDINLQKPNILVAVIDNLKKKEELPCFLVEEKDSSFVPKFTVNEDLVKELDSVCCIDLSGSLKYKLVTEANLPSGYEIESINEVSRDEVMSMMINSAAASEVSSVCSDNFSDKVIIGESSSGASSVCSSHFLSNMSHKLKKAPEPFSYSEELSIGCQVRVVLCHLVSPSDFFVQRECAVKKLADFQALLRPSNLIHSKPPSKLTKGQVYLVNYVKDSKWYRARILDIGVEENMYKVVYIDFGNTEIVPRNRIRSIPRDAISMPVLAIRCKLNNSVPQDGAEWDPRAIALMAKIIDNDYITMIVKDKTPISYIVDLFKFTDCNIINIQNALYFHEFASIAAECEFNNGPFRYNDVILPVEKHSLGDIYEVHVSHVVSPYHFYIQNLYSSKRLLKMVDELHRTTNAMSDPKYSVYHPRQGMYVVARYSRDKRWYRGVIKDCLKGKLMKVFFIDFGGEEEVHWDNVKLLHSKFAKTAPQAIKCSLSDIVPPVQQDDWKIEECSYFRDLIFNKKLKAVVHQTHEDGHLSVILYSETPEVDICINALLVREGKAVSTGQNSVDVEHPKVISTYLRDTKIAVEKSKPSPKKITETLPLVKTQDTQVLSGMVKGPDGTVRIHVLVKKVLNPGEFYVTFFCYNKSLLLLQDDLQKHYNAVTYAQKDWDVDSVCAVKYNNNWFRALVLDKLPENIYRVNLVDEGHEITLGNDSICPLDDKFTTIQDGVIRCHLGGLEPSLPDGWTSSSTRELDEFVNNHKEIIYISKMGELRDSSMPVELFARIEKAAGPTEPTSYVWKSFNHYLRFIGLAKSDGLVEWDCEGNILNRKVFEKFLDKGEAAILGNLFSKSLKVSCEGSVARYAASEAIGDRSIPLSESPKTDFDVLKEHTEVITVPNAWIPAKPLEDLEIIATVTYIDEDCNIYFHDFHKSGDLLENMSMALSMKYNGTLPKPCDATLEAGDICVVLYHGDNCWYRASVLEAKSEFDEYEILCVDYGNVETCKLSELRKIPICHNIPIQVSKGRFVSIEPVHPDRKWGKRDIELVHMTIVGNRCQLQLERIPEKPSEYIVKKLILPDGENLASWMVKNGLAIYKEQYTYTHTLEKQENFIEEKEIIEENAGTKSLKSEALEPKDEEEIDQIVPTEEVQLQEAPELPVMDWFAMTEIEQNTSKAEEDVYEDSCEAIDKINLEVDLPTREDMEVVGPLSNNSLIPTAEIIFHWSKLQDEQKDSIKYKELEIPSSVNMLLVQATAYHSLTMLVLHVCDVEEDPEILENISKFKELSARLQEEGPQQPLLSEPYKCKVCCAQFSGDNQWYRAFVLDTFSDDKLIVQYVDFGNVEATPFSRVRELKEEWAELGVFGLLCELNDITVPEGSYSDPDVLDSLKEMLEAGDGTLRAIIKGRNPGSLKVDIYQGDGLAYEDLIERQILLCS